MSRLLVRPADQSHLSRIAAAEAELIGFGVAAFAVGHPGADFPKELVEGGFPVFADDGRADDLGGKPAGMEIPALGPGDEPVGQGLEFLGDAAGDLDFLIEDHLHRPFLMLEQIGIEVLHVLVDDRDET